MQSFAWKYIVMLRVIMLNIVMLNFLLLSVLVPDIQTQISWANLTLNYTLLFITVSKSVYIYSFYTDSIYFYWYHDIQQKWRSAQWQVV